MERVHRSALKNAGYNPRTIDKGAARKLRENLRKTGLIQPIIWNRRTGNIVGGHQRVAQLDALEGSAEYHLDVAVVDLSEKQEKRQNVFLNNVSAQGSWDTQLLGELVRDDLESVADYGFDSVDIQVLLGEVGEGIFGEAADPAKPDAEAIKKMRENRVEYRKQGKEETNPEFFLVLVFDSSAELDVFAAASGCPAGMRYVDGRAFAERAGIGLVPTANRVDRADAAVENRPADDTDVK